VGVDVLLKLMAGDDVAVHAVTPITATIKVMITAGYNRLRFIGVGDLFMEQKWLWAWVARFHY